MSWSDIALGPTGLSVISPVGWWALGREGLAVLLSRLEAENREAVHCSAILDAHLFDESLVEERALVGAGRLAALTHCRCEVAAVGQSAVVPTFEPVRLLEEKGLGARAVDRDEVADGVSLGDLDCLVHGLTITFPLRTLHSGSDFNDDDVSAFQGLGGLPEGSGNGFRIVGWIHYLE